ncbi:MAG TPA: hypothetical protein VIH59_31055, partial [Candidatus Tectomicrobia bacterium]
MSTDEWRDRIVAFQRQIETAHRVLAAPMIGSGALQTVSEALETSLEELHVAYEELQQQYAAVTMSQHAAATAHRWYQELFDGALDGYLVTDSR